ncbi:MAG: NERD domain-containing protein [Muribaculaceae bacterium]|nr:NERD domain-containing protein [Muribaculaceae bacterium]
MGFLIFILISIAVAAVAIILYHRLFPGRRLNKKEVSGIIGENRVALTLASLTRKEYIVLNDLMFQNGSNTTQIDHIVISRFGIFVIETKNYSGWIFGNASKDYWTQNLWGNRYPLYNPILQNRNHIRFLIRKFRFLNEYREYIHPVVVFLKASRMYLSGDCECVVRLRKLKPYLRSFGDEVLSVEECRYIATLFEEHNIKDRNERASHKQNVMSAIRHHEDVVNNGRCPLCGGRLVYRNGRYGGFYGCSNYPDCRYTR